MASNPPGQCCTIGVKHDGTPKGELKQIAGSKFRTNIPQDTIGTTQIALPYFELTTHLSSSRDLRCNAFRFVCPQGYGHPLPQRRHWTQIQQCAVDSRSVRQQWIPHHHA